MKNLLFISPLLTAREIQEEYNDPIGDRIVDHISARKDWHNLEAQMGRCEACGGLLVEKLVVDPATDSTDVFDVCINPDCPSKDSND